MEEGGPFGRTDHPYLTFCKSIPDLILKWMSMEYLGNLDWCKRRPPLSALRLSHHDALMRRSGYQKRAAAPGARSKAHHHTSQAPILTMHIDDVRKCPFCGSKDIIVAPCPTCQSCGAQLGGCT
jgi:hypothetical protein